MGIEPLAPGWTELQICPRLGGLKWAEARTPTPWGPVFARAEVGPTFQLTVEIPAKTTAIILIPARDINSVTESGKPLAQGKAKPLRLVGDRAMLEVSPGRYHFAAKTQ